MICVYITSVWWARVCDQQQWAVGELPDANFKKMTLTVSYFVLLRGPLQRPGWEGGGGRGLGGQRHGLVGAPDHSHAIPVPGYSLAVLHEASGPSYVAGAPRHKHRGAVFELGKEGRETNLVPVLEGEQVPAGEGLRTLHHYRWGSEARGKGMGSRAHREGGKGEAQPGQTLAPLPWPVHLTASSAPCGGQAALPVPCVTHEDRSIWNDPELVALLRGGQG